MWCLWITAFLMLAVWGCALSCYKITQLHFRPFSWNIVKNDGNKFIVNDILSCISAYLYLGKWSSSKWVRVVFWIWDEKNISVLYFLQWCSLHDHNINDSRGIWSLNPLLNLCYLFFILPLGQIQFQCSERTRSKLLVSMIPTLIPLLMV